MPTLSLVSLNVERSEHLARVVAFLAARMPEVVCMQELLERDIPQISAALGGASSFFVPMTRHIREDSGQIMGIGIFSRLPVQHREALYYARDSVQLPELDQHDPATFNNKNFAVAYADIEKDGMLFRIANTHFTWTPDGKPTDLQRAHLKSMLGVLEPLDEFILAGDFNAPRGGEIFSALAHAYTDNVPASYTSSLDPDLHRAGPLPFMVDGIFSTPKYTVSQFEMISGVSDHRALVAAVSTAD